ncbi:glycoside hydrolases [Nesidiocoris tenuis]|uniref:beta-glucosidase n=1 Tax=Nesidiocoris tenuis TaxID=355587 RepID=A0ABN7ANY6_9HEMI|nr:glycoside hydrolases [Nesidiocoris tenuis]
MFPKDFIFSTSTAAYQVEGAWNESGKGVSIWDDIVHRDPSFIADRSNGDTAADSFHLYKEDVQLVKHLGFRMYRFSISWPRVLPDGSTKFINEPGVKYYEDLIDELLANDIAPMVTIYHWDLPQMLQQKGGWLNSTIVDDFEKYADFVFSRFASKVKWWITINEPFSITTGYGGDDYAPGLTMHGIGDYLAGHNLLKAHARAYRLYKSKYSKFEGKLSLSLDANGAYPKDETNEEDIRAANRFMEFELGWFAHPVFSRYGNYPAVLRDRVDLNSAREGRDDSRLPYFTKDEIEEIRGTYDFFALNHYSSRLCTSGKTGPTPSWSRDSNVVTSFNDSWPPSQSSWLKVAPEGFRKVLNWIKTNYDNPEVFVTENGFSDYNQLHDLGRIDYLKGYLSELSKAINEDGCNVIGYTVWSILDNFEWRAGYTERFGLVHVDFNSPNRTRTMKQSATFIKKFIKENSFDSNENEIQVMYKTW